MVVVAVVVVVVVGMGMGLRRPGGLGGRGRPPPARGRGVALVRGEPPRRHEVLRFGRYRQGEKRTKGRGNEWRREGEQGGRRGDAVKATDL